MLLTLQVLVDNSCQILFSSPHTEILHGKASEGFKLEAYDKKDDQEKFTQEEIKSDKVFKRLEQLNIYTTTYNHPPLFTVEDSKKLRGDLPGTHCKNLFLRAKKNEMWLIVCREDLKIDLKGLGQKLGGSRLSFGSPERLLNFLGVMPGSVSPFALINDKEHVVKVVLDKDMMEGSLLNFHPLTNEKTTAIKPDDLAKYISSCGHNFEILDLN